MPISIATGSHGYQTVQRSDRVQDSSFRFCDLPSEMKVEVIRANPDATFRLMDTSREMEDLVLSVVLRPLHRHFLNYKSQSRFFVESALRRGRTPAQIVHISDALGDNDPASRSERLIKAGMLTIRSHNAMSEDMLAFLCMPRVLMHTFEVSLPLLGTEELSGAHGGLDSEPIPPGPRVIKVEGRDVYISQLDLVFVRCAYWLGEDGIVGLLSSQLRHRERLAKPLICPGVAADVSDGTNVCANVEREAQRDADAVALILRRYLSAQTIREIDHNPNAREGALHRTLFPDTDKRNERPQPLRAVPVSAAVSAGVPAKAVARLAPHPPPRVRTGACTII